MKIVNNQTLFTGLVLYAMLLLNACKPIREIKQAPAPFKGDNQLNRVLPAHNESKKNVFIVADNNGTEIFDLLTPFHLFHATGKANVYIIARDRKPIPLKQHLFVLPQLTLSESDSMKINADVIVIPALSARTEHQDTALISWIKNHFLATTKILAICDGASTAAATGLYDGKPMTCHASDYQGIKSHFPKVDWVQNVNTTKSGNLYSTAGVSNAVEGSLTVINDLFDRETMLLAANSIHYPNADIKTAHSSVALSGKTKFSIAKKVISRKNKNIGILLQNGLNEFLLAAIIDTYTRSFPYALTSFCQKDSTIQTKYGLTLLSQSIPDLKKFDEVHIPMPYSQTGNDAMFSKHTQIVSYSNSQRYAIDDCLERIKGLYSAKFGNAVKILLDYN